MKKNIVEELIREVRETVTDPERPKCYSVFALEGESENALLLGGIPAVLSHREQLEGTAQAAFAAKRSGASAIYFAADAWMRTMALDQVERERAEHGRELAPSELPLDDRESVIFITRADMKTGTLTGQAFRYKGGDMGTAERLPQFDDADPAAWAGAMVQAIRAGIEAAGEPDEEE